MTDGRMDKSKTNREFFTTQKLPKNNPFILDIFYPTKTNPSGQKTNFIDITGRSKFKNIDIFGSVSHLAQNRYLKHIF